MKDTLRHLRDRARASLLSGNPDSALRAVAQYVDTVRSNEMCTARVLCSSELDQVCEQAGKLIKARSDFTLKRSASVDTCKWFHVVSRLQASGGHTRLLRNVIQAYPEKEHIVVATNIDRQSERQAVTALINLGSNVFFINIESHCGFECKTKALMSHVSTANPEKAFLFCHHQDAVAVAAMANSSVDECYFVHHADHHLCLGVHIESFIHIDLNKACYNSCSKKLKSKHIYLPLTAEAPRASHAPIRKKVLTTCTAARSNKISPAYHTQYWEVIPEILHRTKGTHIHIGHLSPAIRRKIFARMRHRNINPSNFVYTPFVEKISDSLLNYNVNLYIGSFPYAGALTMVEVMASGIPIAVHRNAVSDLLGCREIAYPGAFEWSCAEELYAYCASITHSHLAESGARAKAYYNEFHTPTQIRKVLDSHHCSVFQHASQDGQNVSDGCLQAEVIYKQTGLCLLIFGMVRRLMIQAYSFLTRVFASRTR